MDLAEFEHIWDDWLKGVSLGILVVALVALYFLDAFSQPVYSMVLVAVFLTAGVVVSAGSCLSGLLPRGVGVPGLLVALAAAACTFFSIHQVVFPGEPTTSVTVSGLEREGVLEVPSEVSGDAYLRVDGRPGADPAGGDEEVDATVSLSGSGFSFSLGVKLFKKRGGSGKGGKGPKISRKGSDLFLLSGLPEGRLAVRLEKLKPEKALPLTFALIHPHIPPRVFSIALWLLVGAALFLSLFIAGRGQFPVVLPFSFVTVVWHTIVSQGVSPTEPLLPLLGILMGSGIAASAGGYAAGKVLQKVLRKWTGSTSTAALLCMLVLFAGACSGGNAGGAEVGADAWEQDLEVWEPPPLPDECTNPVAGLLHVASWPGLGLGVVLRAVDDDGVPRTELAPDEVKLDYLGKEVEVAVAPAVAERTWLLIVLAEPDDAPQAQGEELADFVDTLPPDMPVALYARCGKLLQVAGFTDDRILLRSLLTTGVACGEDERVDLWLARDQAIEELARIGGYAFSATRFLLMVGAELPELPEIPSEGRTMFLHSVVAGSDGLSADGLTAVGEKMAAEGLGLFALGACPGGEPKDTAYLTTTANPPCPLPLPKGPKEEQFLECDADAIAAGDRKFPTLVEFSFADDQKELFDLFVEEKIEDDFGLWVKMGDADPVEARAHLRGQTSLDCVRKSFTVNLKGNRPRHILPDSATDEFYLISMCKDDRYFQQYTANILAGSLGLFPLRFGLAELVVEGETRGVYLLLEKTKEALLEDNSRVKTILRRRFDPGGKPPEVKYPSGVAADNPLLDPYWAVVAIADGLSGEELVDEMQTLIDLDQFLTLVAFHTLTGNGDWVDELFWYSMEAFREGAVVEWYRFMAWDMDDLFSACHHSGKHAMEDPHDILFCAEGNLEKAILLDPAIYERFITILEDLMYNQVTSAHLDAALAETEAALLPWFDRPEICGAMAVLLKQNPEAADPAVAKAEILEKMDLLRTQYDNNFAKLETSIKAYRDGK